MCRFFWQISPSTLYLGVLQLHKWCSLPSPKKTRIHYQWPHELLKQRIMNTRKDREVTFSQLYVIYMFIYAFEYIDVTRAEIYCSPIVNVPRNTPIYDLFLAESRIITVLNIILSAWYTALGLILSICEKKFTTEWLNVKEINTTFVTRTVKLPLPCYNFFFL